jgi:integrase/recombinase XerD
MRTVNTLRKSYLEQFRIFLTNLAYSQKTIDTYVFHVEKLKENFSVDKFQYKDVIRTISDPKFSLRYRQVIVAALKQYYHFLMWNGTRHDHPCPNLRIRSNFSKNFIQQDFLTSEELRLLRGRIQRYQLLDLRDKVLLSILTIQGLAPNEVCALNLQHVNLLNKTVSVAASRKYKKRKLNLLPEQVALIAAYIHESRSLLTGSTETALLVGMNGKRITTDSIHYLISTLSGMIPDKRITPQIIRQSVITWWINDLKIPLEQAQLMSGHRWISSTQKYEFTNSEEDVALVNKWQ